ncbi:uncharacterized protein B0P05DRAFT_532759 [Gilbertella persicaria]|uniref:uncharacterized protein n=1 Tax=Gilbertella persicaria TaxID=101096 RepID=UPI00221E3FF5|nr:uncharacterized protein B0P05DRAFT_532759 [Gilbertella persicaria]KAI8086881.1 hypothetical protein B0P05DRAFT_532759 [Gilbertella persicaria]
MSFLLRPSSRVVISNTAQIIKRQAHKKANIQVKLNEFVDGLGIQGEIIAVRPGLMRNILYPSGKASYVDKKQANNSENGILEATKEASLDAQRLQELAQESEQKKKQLLGHLEGVRELSFNRAVVPNSDHTFGSVTADDLISKLREEYGLEVDKSTIEFKSEGGRIKSLGKHQISVQIGQETAEINVIVNPAA